MKTIKINFVHHGRADRPLTLRELQDFGASYKEFQKHPRIHTKGFEIEVEICRSEDTTPTSDVFYQNRTESNDGKTALGLITNMFNHGLLDGTTITIQGMTHEESVTWLTT